LLAMVVNDNACLLAKRGALESIASKLTFLVGAAAGCDLLAFDGLKSRSKDRSLRQLLQRIMTPVVHSTDR